MYPVTVIIPHWDEPRERLCATVASCLEARAAEVLVVDDGSQYPPTCVDGARLVYQSHRGIAAALNAGLARASQPWIAVLGCGDLATRHRFRMQLAVDHPAVFSDFYDHLNNTIRQPLKWWQQLIYRDNQFSWCTALARTDLLRAIGGWNEGLTYAVDWEMSILVQWHFGWRYVHGVVAECSELPGGHTARGQNTERRRIDRKGIMIWAQELVKGAAA